jgi:hypothetical protein
VKKRGRQLAAEIDEVLAKPPTHGSRRPSPDVAAVFSSLADNAEAYGAENLSLARRDEGYTGDPKEFRYSVIFARRLPTYKYELLVDYIEEYRLHPHERLGRLLTAKEAIWMEQEARRIRDGEQQSLRETP